LGGADPPDIPHMPELFSGHRGVSGIVQGGFFLRKNPLGVRAFVLHQPVNSCTQSLSVEADEGQLTVELT
jgi:hypothetical protein